MLSSTIRGSQACHPERLAVILSAAKDLCVRREILRGVYPERSAWAQGDRLSLQMSILRAESGELSWSHKLFQGSRDNSSTGYVAHFRPQHVGIYINRGSVMW